MMTFSEKKAIPLILLLTAIFLVYSNACDGSWHLDDLPNITQNTRLHLKKLAVDDIVGTFFAKPGGGRSNQLYRPVACLTFALNWYFGQQEAGGYLMVNVTIHFLTAFLLYLTALALLKTPNITKRFSGNEQFIALLAAVLWAMNPVQTQAVDYIVQRMTALATLFYLLSIYLYIKARMGRSPVFRGTILAGCIVSYMLAMGSKENAAILPLGLLLVDIIFFQNPDRSQSDKRLFGYAVASGICVFLTAVLFFLKGDLFSFLDGYTDRPFSLAQRLLTEPRILIFYLSQLFFPLASRLSIQHDVVISTSIVDPWTTLPAIFMVLVLVALAMLGIRKRPLAAFGILFFFLNHLIESTVLPLELLFEHRNYLPSLFIFLPVAACTKQLQDALSTVPKAYSRLAACCLVLVLIALGMNTYARNRVWATQKSLWQDAKLKAPQSARPYQNLAAYHKQAGNYDDALNLYHTSLELYDPKPKQSLATSLNNSGIIYAKMGEYDRAIDYYHQALVAYPDHEKTLHNLTVALVQMGNWEQALKSVDVILSKYYHPRYLNLKGFILLKQNRPGTAADYLMRALKMAPASRNTAINLAMAFSRTDRFAAAERILQRANRRFLDDATILLCRVENSLRAGESSKTDRLIDRLFSVSQATTLKKLLAKTPELDRLVPYSSALLAPVIGARLRIQTDNLLKGDRSDGGRKD
jgi:tetratricopeptide (TPR) repeat protein